MSDDVKVTVSTIEDGTTWVQTPRSDHGVSVRVSQTGGIAVGTHFYWDMEIPDLIACLKCAEPIARERRERYEAGNGARRGS